MAACWMLGTALPVSAQSDDDRARTHFEAGRSYYDQARYAEAAREFEASYELSPHPELLLNISQAEERALNYDAAIDAAQRYLTTNPKATDRNTVEDRIASLKELKQRFEQQGGPEPLPPPGGTGAAATAAAAAAPAPSTTAPPPTAAAAAVPPPAASTATSVSVPEPPPQSSDRFTVPAIVLMGTGGAALVASLVTGLVAHADYTSLERQCDGNLCPPSAQDELDEGKTLSVVSTVLTVIGVLAAGTGATLLVIDAQTEPEPAPRPGQLSFGTGSTPASLRASLTF